MFSVIIPTMWRCKRVLRSLLDMELSPLVGEIIIIDNDYKNRPQLRDLKKLKILTQENNIYVNPAWNLGAEHAKFYNLCFLNDDISFSCNQLFYFGKHFLDHNPFACAGLHHSSYSLNRSVNPIDCGEIERVSSSPGWGQCIFIKKYNWINIPSRFKIWYGDNFLVEGRKLKAHAIACPVRSVQHTTTSRSDPDLSRQFRSIINKEKRLWKNFNLNLVLIKATYGDLESENKKIDISHFVQWQIDKGTYEFSINNAIAAKDPAPGIPKTAFIEYVKQGISQKQLIKENRCFRF